MAVHQLESNEEQSEIPTHAETRAWVNEHLGKTIKNHMLVRLGHEGMMLDKVLKQNKIVRDGVRAFQRGETTVNAAAATEDDAGVNIGNEIHYHGVSQPAAPVTPTVAPPAAPTPAPAPAASNPWKTAALLGAGAIAAGVPASLATWYLNRPAESTNTTVIKPGDQLDVQLKLPPPTKP